MYTIYFYHLHPLLLQLSLDPPLLTSFLLVCLQSTESQSVVPVCVLCGAMILRALLKFCQRTRKYLILVVFSRISKNKWRHRRYFQTAWILLYEFIQLTDLFLHCVFIHAYPIHAGVGGQRVGSFFSTMPIFGIRFRWSDLKANALIYWAILPV